MALAMDHRTMPSMLAYFLISFSVLSPQAIGTLSNFMGVAVFSVSSYVLVYNSDRNVETKSATNFSNP
ncbi:hypothetical protein RJ641_018507 [Dillenia turbinata]|uniref:Uncharacterized protein n=1 Tax=Dillenia turbinata TaxID=194707 RepID=A0AAN8UUC2_9MAGN